MSVLRLEAAGRDAGLFRRFCGLELADNAGGAEGARGETMDRFEWVELLKAVGVLAVETSDRCPPPTHTHTHTLTHSRRRRNRHCLPCVARVFAAVGAAMVRWAGSGAQAG